MIERLRTGNSFISRQERLPSVEEWACKTFTWMKDLCQGRRPGPAREARFVLRILVATPKGGCGKTTIATQLAAAFAAAGHLTVLADADRQRSSLGWLARRPQGAAAI